MVRLATWDPTPVYLVLDNDDRPIGRVEAPAGTPKLGRGAGTVLLRRTESRSEGGVES